MWIYIQSPQRFIAARLGFPVCTCSAWLGHRFCFAFGQGLLGLPRASVGFPGLPLENMGAKLSDHKRAACRCRSFGFIYTARKGLLPHALLFLSAFALLGLVSRGGGGRGGQSEGRVAACAGDA